MTCAPHPRKPSREDCEYKRNGTRNLFVFVEPKAGFRQILITRHRKKVDFACAIRYLGDVLYPHYHLLVEHFGKVEADRIMNRLCFHFTPPHASWLNMAEIELSVLSQQCLDRRLTDEMTLATEILAWEERRNAVGKPFN